jgi:hypothetical protein
MGNNQLRGNMGINTTNAIDLDDYIKSVKLLGNKHGQGIVEVLQEIFPKEKLKREINGFELDLKNKISNSTINSLDTAENSYIDLEGVKRNSITDYEFNFKTADSLRTSYLTKLISVNLLKPNFKKYNSVIIFDWDDTLLPTTFISPNGIFRETTYIEPIYLLKIKKLEEFVYKLLDLALSKSDTYIITNAAPGWVQYSAKQFYPSVLPLLKRTHIISARGEFEGKFPNDGRQWKIMAFLNILKRLDHNLVTNLICIGDSVNEMEAAYVLASQINKAVTKTVKFREGPSPEELNKQIRLVIQQFDYIYANPKGLTVKVQKIPKGSFFN